MGAAPSSCFLVVVDRKKRGSLGHMVLLSVHLVEVSSRCEVCSVGVGVLVGGWVEGLLILMTCDDDVLTTDAEKRLVMVVTS
mgnify:CR=1 FL=1